MMKRARMRGLLTLAVSGSLLLAACGSGSSGSDDTSSDTSADTSTETSTGDSMTESETTAAGTDDSSGEGTDVVKAAWIYVGPINDGGWTTAHNEGLNYVAEQLGDSVETTYKENIPEGPEVAQVIDDLVADGNNIIFATSFGFGDAMKAAAEKYPDVAFEWATGDAPTDNMSIYFGAGEQSLYLAGMAAGAETESNVIGFVAPFPIPEVIRHINAYALGAQEVNPDAVVKVVWVNSWFDPTNERQAADSLISEGADVIASGGDSPAPGEAAKAAGVGWTGYDSDQSANFPDEWLTAAIYDWGPYYLQEVKKVMDGSWAAGDYYGNMADGFTDIAPFGSRVDQETQDLITERRQQIIDGEFDIFAGPIVDQEGTEQVAEGSSMDFGTQMSITWFVKGVEGNPAGS